MSDATRKRSTQIRVAQALGLVFTAAALFAEVTKASDSFSDPTRPAVFAVTTETAKVHDTSQLVLHAILFAEGRRVAIINDQRVHENDVVLSARVVSIERDRVELRRDSVTIELQLVAHDVKQPRPPAALDSIPESSLEGLSPGPSREGESQ